MKKIVIFAGFFGMLILGTNAMAEDVNASLNIETFNDGEYAAITVANNTLPTDSNNYSGYNPTNGTNADSTIKIATTKYVDTQATTTQTAVSGLTTTATTDNGTVNTNGTAITGMIRERQVALAVPTDCSTGLGSQYSGCGYMVKNGNSNDGVTAGNYEWYKIIK